MKQTHALAAIGAFLVGTVAVLAITSPTVRSAPADTKASQGATFPEHAVWSAWKVYCDSCHTGPKARAGVNTEALDLANLDKNGAVWEKILTKLRNHTMPPPGSPMPDDATFQTLIKSITGERDRVADVRPTPGRPTLHRLNRAEYGNAIRDLLALDVDVSELLPPDDSGYGFDNIGDVLTVSPGLLERYLLAAGKISRQAVGDTKMPATYQTYTVPHGLKQDDRMADDLPVGSRGGTVIQHRFPVDGEYEIQVDLQRGRAQEIIGTGRERKLDLRFDDESVKMFTIAARGRRADINTGVGQEAQAGAG